ncbi:MAG: tetratricopeptide repeat protein [Clostridiales bacterium]|nr:tetratricopeptide repeat protein [Clostridiales bacterium]MCF8022502.1 tetratricopeptide repeat protein [Clostridiales bacterium]
MSIFINASKNKKRQKIIFFITAVLMAAGLIGSTLIGAFASNEAKTASQQMTQPGANNVSQLEKQVKENPQNADLLEKLAKAYYRENQLDKSIKSYKKALELEPASAELRTSYAITLFDANEYKKAVDQMEKEIKQNPGNNTAHFYLGEFYAYGLKDYSSAIDELNTFVKNSKAEDENVKHAKQIIKELDKKE